MSLQRCYQKTAPRCESEASTTREILVEESGWTKAGTEAKADSAGEKAESILGDQEKALGSPESVCQRTEKQGSTTDELTVKFNHA